MEPDPVKLAFILDDYDRLAKRVEDLERRMRIKEEIDARLTSINVGHKDKGGEIKVYIDPYGDPTVNAAAIDETMARLRQAGGTPASGGQ